MRFTERDLDALAHLGKPPQRGHARRFKEGKTTAALEVTGAAVDNLRRLPIALALTHPISQPSHRRRRLEATGFRFGAKASNHRSAPGVRRQASKRPSAQRIASSLLPKA